MNACVLNLKRCYVLSVKLRGSLADNLENLCVLCLERLLYLERFCLPSTLRFLF